MKEEKRETTNQQQVKPKKKKHMVRKIFRITFLLLLFIAFGVSLFLFFRYKDDLKDWQAAARQSVSTSTKKDFTPVNISYIYDKNGDQIAKLSAAEKSTYLSYDQIPEAAIDAFIAVEDRSFWTNKGYDLKGIGRVAYTYIRSEGETINGASTITQQLARKIYLTNEVSLERKVKEIMIAIELTKMYSKKQIMEFYVNNCNFGNNIYGMEVAAQTYFGIPAEELSLSQIAYLCAIPNRPTYYDPYKDATRALKRRNKILEDMAECGYITDRQLAQAKSETIAVIPKPDTEGTRVNNYQTTYAIDCAAKYLMRQNNFKFQYDFSTQEEFEAYQKEYDTWYSDARDKLYTGGYRIYTSLDSEAQNTLQSIVDNELNMDVTLGSSGMYDFQGAMTAIDNTTGKVIAIIGGRSQEGFMTSYTLNRAYQGYRQPGSSIKPLIVYTPALLNEFTPESILYNIDVTAAKQKDAVVSKMTGASFTLRSAVEQSKNGCAYQLFNDIGPYYGISFLKDMEFDEIVPADATLSAALGGLTYGVTTTQMAAAYRTLSNEGMYSSVTCITSIKDINGTELYMDRSEKQIYTAEAASTMTDILQGVISKGTASSMRWSSTSKVEAAGKTGTTNDSKDGWFCGYTPYFTISVWVGYDTPKTLSSLYGSTYPATIWKESMSALLEQYGYETGSFTKEDGRDTSNEEFLPGRSDSELLSEGYTVRDYRSDHTIGKNVGVLITQITQLDSTAADYAVQKADLVAKAQQQINTVVGRTYRSQLQGELDAVNVQ